jgi:hypothetical protein
MESLARENEHVPAIGNQKVNARGDQISHGQITKTAEQIARENHRVQSVVVNTGLKGKIPATPEMQEQPAVKASKKSAPAPKTKETELSNGDIIVDGDNSES